MILPNGISTHRSDLYHHRSIHHWRESSPYIENQMQDLNRWNQLIRQKFGSHFMWDPVMYYTRLLEKRKIHAFLESRSKEQYKESVRIDARLFSRELLSQILDLIGDREYKKQCLGKVNHRIRHFYSIYHQFDFVFYLSGEYRLLQSDEDNREYSGTTKVPLDTLEEILMIVPMNSIIYQGYSSLAEHLDLYDN